MKNLFVLFCLITALHPVHTCAQWGIEGNEGANPHVVFQPRFHAAFDVLQFKENRASHPSEDSTRIDIYLAVPYSSLQFLYDGKSYVAEYSVSLRIAHSDTLVRDLFTSYSVVEPAAEHHTNGPVRADAEQLSFHLPPGYNYRFQLTLHDSYSKHDFDTNFIFSVRRFPNDTPAISDLLLYRDRTGMNIVPSIGPDVSSLESRTSIDTNRLANDSKGIFAELYNAPENATLGIVSEAISDDSISGKGTIAYRSTAMVQTVAGSSRTFTAPARGATIVTTPVFAPMDLRHLWLGQYSLRTYILPALSDTNISDTAELARRSIASASRIIRVGIAPGVPISLNDLDQAIDQLRIIATSTEWDSLSNAKTRQQKRDAILNFWSHKRFTSSDASQNSYGPGDNEAMEIFYARIEYANQHFSTGFGQGWRSDRGHVYIALGAPDKMEDNAQGYSQTFGGMQRAYQVWSYTRLGMSYAFVDDYGLGDYRLRGVFPPEGTFQW